MLRRPLAFSEELIALDVRNVFEPWLDELSSCHSSLRTECTSLENAHFQNLGFYSYSTEEAHDQCQTSKTCQMKKSKGHEF